MKTPIRILSLGALVIAALLAVFYFALPSSELRLAFPQPGNGSVAQPGIGTPQPSTASEGGIAAPALVATAGNGEITISWQTVEGAASYELWFRYDDVPWAQVATGVLTGSTTSYTHTGLTASKKYFYTARAVPATGPKSSWAGQAEATVSDTPGAPALTASPAIGKIDLIWSTITGTESYHLITWTDGQADWERIGDPITGTTTSYTHSDLTPGITHHYRVRAVINSMEGDWSDSVSAVPTVPAAPSLTAAAATGQVQLSWSAVPYAESYNIIVHTEGVKDWVRIGDPISGTTTSYTHTDLVGEQSYFYKVRAVVDGIEGEWSLPIAAIPALPAAPSLTATVATGQVQLSWNAVTGADSYDLVVWTETRNAWLRIGQPLTHTITSYTHSSLSETETYYYRISAQAGNSGSEWSSTISAVPATSSIPGLVATGSKGQVQLSWNAVTGAESYHLITWTDGQSDWTRIGDPLSGGTTSYTHSGTAAGKTYFYRVRAVVAGSNGEWSGEVDVTP